MVEYQVTMTAETMTVKGPTIISESLISFALSLVLPTIPFVSADSHASRPDAISPVKMQNIVRILKDFFNKMRFWASFIGTFVLF